MYKLITSTQNPEIKFVLNLQEKSRERKKTGLFVAEGVREIKLALEGNYEIENLYFLKPHIHPENNSDIFSLVKNVSEISTEVYQKIAYRDTTEGIVAILKSKEHDLKNLRFKTDRPLILISESPEKPGNIGALLRTADAAGVDAIIIANPKTDLYNPNVIRSSVGCVFTTQIAVGKNDEIINYLKKNTIQILTAALKPDAQNYLNQDFTKSTAIVVGTESTGLSEDWFKATHQNIIIPMKGKIDSLNVSVSAAIILFEAERQRFIQ